MQKEILKPTTIFIVGSRTGGPLIPLLGLKDELAKCRNDLKFMIVGIQGGFEESAAKTENLPILFLPEAKFKRPHLSGASPLKKIISVIELPFTISGTLFRLIHSFYRSLVILRRENPALILSMSNFLIVPLAWAKATLNFFRKINNSVKKISGRPSLPTIKIALHQMDITNLTVRLTAPFSDLYTAGFQEIADKAKRSIQVIPNPVRYDKFDTLNQADSIQKLFTAKLVDPSLKKPLLLIFGGGSGSAFINNWVLENQKALLEKFQILHLYGFLQKNVPDYEALPGFIQKEGLKEMMPAALVAADAVLSRAGMSTISELLYLKKRAYLVPIPGTHQEENARIVAPLFPTLRQSNSSSWLNTLLSDFQHPKEKSDLPLNNYYSAKNRYLYRDMILNLLPSKP